MESYNPLTENINPHTEQKTKKKTLVGVFVFLVLAVGIGLTVYAARQQQILRSRAAVSSLMSLVLTSNKTQVSPGEVMTLTGTYLQLGYTGLVDVQKCDSANVCTDTTGGAGLMMTNGILNYTFPAGTANGSYTLKVKPRG